MGSACVKSDVWVMEDLGLIFFHNGRGLLKLNKRVYLSSLDNPRCAAELVRSNPDFFEISSRSECVRKLEACKIDFLDRPK